MSDTPKSMNRIPFESLEGAESVTSWNIPTVQGKKSRMVFSAKRDKKNESKEDASSEVIEDYKSPVKPKPLTAEELKHLAEDAKAEGYQIGYQEGLAKGMKDGTAKGHKQGEQKAYKDTHARVTGEANKLHHIAQNLIQPMQEQEGALEKIIVDMAMHYAQALLQDEITQSPQKLLNLIKSAIVALPAGSKNISVILGVEDSALIDKYIPANQRSWEIEIDPGIQSGGFRIETHESLVDYTVESRLQNFLQSVKEQGDVDETAVAPVMEISEEDITKTKTEDLTTQDLTTQDDALAKQEPVQESEQAPQEENNLDTETQTASESSDMNEKQNPPAEKPHTPGDVDDDRDA